jgi:hypothetical protein
LRSLLLSLTVFSFVLLLACEGQTTANQTSNPANKIPTPSPTVSAEERKAEEEKAAAEIDKAIKEFITKNYKGWKFKAISDEYSCYEGSESPCDLLLTKNGLDKVISVMIKRFEDENGKAFLVVFEARAIDLIQLKINGIKDTERQTTLENLTIDDVPDDLRTEIYLEERDALGSIQDDIEPYDPR